MDGEINRAANYEVKKKGAGKLICNQIKNSEERAVTRKSGEMNSNHLMLL